MRWALISALMLLSSSLEGQLQPCDCRVINPLRQYRGTVMHERHFEVYPPAKDPITPKTLAGWQRAYRRVTKTINAETGRLSNTPEDTLYTLRGRLYFVRHETGILGVGGDCDFHMEIGTDDPNDLPHVVVEVTKENCELQKQILETLKQHGFGLGDDIQPGIPCTVVGLGFYDGFHKPAHHGRRQSHGS